MGEISVGCQTAVWGEYRWGHLEETLAGVSQAGYDGVEIGARFLDLDEPDIFQELLKRYNLTLAGLHFGVRWYDPRAVEEAKPQLLKVVDFLAALGMRGPYSQRWQEERGDGGRRLPAPGRGVERDGTPLQGAWGEAPLPQPRLGGSKLL